MNRPGSPSTITATFVLRFWYENAAGEERWRGSIKHIQSGEEIAFLQFETMLNFLRHFGIRVRNGDRITTEKTRNK